MTTQTLAFEPGHVQGDSMAICSRCFGTMGQVQTVCPHCGFDFSLAEPKPTLFSRLTKFFWFCVLLIWVGAIFHYLWPDFYRDITYRPCLSFWGQVPPELVASGEWMNSSEPVTLQSLRGNVVWLEFSFYRCGGCRAMTPQLVEWHRKYAKKGLVIADVYNAQADKEFSDDPLADLRGHVMKERVSYPVLFDEAGTNCRRYGVEGYPSGYLLDRAGKVIWEDAPHGNQARVERKIVAALDDE